MNTQETAMGDAQPEPPFRLVNEKPAAAKRDVADEPRNQRTLFAGLDCLPGQLDLFPTDGESSAECKE